MIRWLLLGLLASPAGALTVEVTPQPSAQDEAIRLDRMPWSDETPTGLWGKPGDVVSITLPDLPEGVTVALSVGFWPMWSADPGRQEVALSEGAQIVELIEDGPLHLRVLGQGDAIRIDLTGRPMPLWRDGTWANGVYPDADWTGRDASAPWVQVVSDRVLLTLTPDVLVPGDIDQTLMLYDSLLAGHDALAGLDGSIPRHAPSPNRVHLLVDTWTPEADRDAYWMYAAGTHIGLRPENAGEAVRAGELAYSWGVHHELGHLYQPESWTWGEFTEVNVNLWSLYAEEALSRDSRLDREPEHREAANALLAQGMPGPLAPVDPFIRLVMLDRLRAVYGWDMFIAVNRAMRETPLPRDATEADKVAAFLQAVADATGHDLSGYFAEWGFRDARVVWPATLPPVDPQTMP